MIKLVPTEQWHIEYLRSIGEIPDEIYAIGYAGYIVKAGPTVSVFDDGELVACAGLVDLWDGVADFWSIITDKLRLKPIALVKATRAFMQIIDEYVRVQATVIEGDEKAEEFINYLGFTFEGEMRYYGPNRETHIRYARINRCQV